MAHHPILRPDDSEDSLSFGTSHAVPAGDETVYPLNELTNTFVAHGAGVVSADLALDLVLNDIVKQACLATGASGAAVALRRAGEMVCRASSGAAAPDLGVRLDTRAGLAGAAVESGELQLCRDTESDHQVDPETCRRLGIRSIMVLPLLEEGEVFGIFEVVSAHRNAFGELDVITLKALAQQIVHNRRQAHETKDNLETGLVQAEAAGREYPMPQEPSTDPGLEPQIVKPSEVVPAGGVAGAKHTRSARQGDFLTGFFAVLVIGMVVLMALTTGWRLGWSKAVARQWHASSRTGLGKKPETVAVGNAVPPALTQGSSRTPTVSETPAAANAHPTARPAAKPPAAAPPIGGLVVYEKGKVIFTMPPSAPEKLSAKQETATTQQGVVLAAEISPDPQRVDAKIAEARLVHRVTPQYPAEAQREHVEGPVVLSAEISRDGMVQKLTVLKGDPALSQSAVQAVSQWRYRPYLINGHPVDMQTTITVNFSLPAE